MHPESTTSNTAYWTADTVQAVNANGTVLMQFPASSTTITTNAGEFPTWTIEGAFQPYTYYGTYDTDSISIPADLSKSIKDLGYNLSILRDLFADFCQRLIDLNEDMRLDEAFHDSEDLDDFLKEFIVNNKKS